MLKNYFKATKILKPIMTFWLCLLSYGLFSQSAEKQIIRVEKMEYVYSVEDLSFGHYFISDSKIFVPTSRVVLATDSEMADKMKQSILNAINIRWDATILNPQWDLKAINQHSKPLKFKTTLKKGIPGNWHLFLQIIDNGPYPINDKTSSFFSSYPAFESRDKFPYYFQFKVTIIDGSNESIVFSNDMMVEMQRTDVPVGQLLLRKLPALTDSFLHAFDTAAQKLFATSPQKELLLDVTPACLFLDTDKTYANVKRLNFVTKNDSIIELLQLKQEWIIQNTKTRKTKRKNNFGNNLFNSTFTNLTGLSTDKIRAMGYVAKFGFIDTNDNSRYFCEIPYVEETREEKEREVTKDAYGTKSYDSYLNGNKTVKHSFNSEQMYYLIREKDTIGNFRLVKGDRAGSKNNLSQYWDGKNESTISTIPDFWGNSQSSISPFILEGELNKVPFIIENGKAGNQTDIEIDSREMMTLKIYNSKPVFGILYSNPADEKALSILMMLSTMPFNSIF